MAKIPRLVFTQEPHDADNLILEQDGQRQHSLDALALGGIMKGQIRVFIDMVCVHRISGLHHLQSLTGINGFTAQIFHGHAMGSSQNKALGGFIQEANGAGIGIEELGQFPHHGFHDLLVIQHLGGHADGFEEDIEKAV